MQTLPLHRSKICGIAVTELNRLELEFLLGIDFNLRVYRDEYAWWAEELLTFAVRNQLDAQTCPNCWKWYTRRRLSEAE